MTAVQNSAQNGEVDRKGAGARRPSYFAAPVIRASTVAGASVPPAQDAQQVRDCSDSLESPPKLLDCSSDFNSLLGSRFTK